MNAKQDEFTLAGNGEYFPNPQPAKGPEVAGALPGEVLIHFTWEQYGVWTEGSVGAR